tara:strand:- start:4913 stop:5089 length:177 start_codon:yes stop_codon:yes gene_type:complete
VLVIPVPLALNKAPSTPSANACNSVAGTTTKSVSTKVISSASSATTPVCQFTEVTGAE